MTQINGNRLAEQLLHKECKDVAYLVYSYQDFGMFIFLAKIKGTYEHCPSGHGVNAKLEQRYTKKQ